MQTDTITSSELRNLPPELRAEFEQIVVERERRFKEERGRYFVPIKPSNPNAFGCPSNDQAGLWESDADEIWVFGGNRSGKTAFMVNFFDQIARGVHSHRSAKHPPPVKLRLVAPKWGANVEGVLLQKFREMTPRAAMKGGSWRSAWREKTHTLYYENGSLVQFKSYEEDLDTFDGIDLDGVGHDEHGSESIYDKEKSRLLDRGGFFMCAMTPEKGQTWEWDHVQHPPEGLSVVNKFFTPMGNPYLNAEAVKKRLLEIRDEAVREAKIFGRFVALGGVVIPQYNKAIHIVPDRHLHPSAYRMFCIDMHHRKASAAMWVAWEPIEGSDELKLVVYRTMKEFMTVPQWQEEIRVKSAGEKIQDWVSDDPDGDQGKDLNAKSSMSGQLTEGKKGIPVIQVSKPSGSFAAGIMKLRDMFMPDPMTGKSRVEIFESCNYEVRMINGDWCGSLPWELERYQYKTTKVADEETLREHVRKVNDHYVDDLRYLAMLEPNMKEGGSSGPKYMDDAEKYMGGEQGSVYG